MVADQVMHEAPELKKVNWFSALKQTIQEFMADDAMGMGAEMAYHFFFALFPTLLVLLSLLGVLDTVYRDGNFTGQLLDMLGQAVPATAYQAIEPVIRDTVEKANGVGALLGFGFILAIWSASAGVQSLMKGFNVAYDVQETRNFIKQKLVALGLTLGIALFVVLAMALLVFGGRIGEAIANAVGLGALFTWAWNIGRLILMGIFLIIGLAILYYAAPNVKHNFVWISPGSVVAGILWLLFTFLFSIYINNFAGMSSYGVVGGVMALVLWMYYSSLVLLLGAEMNGVLGQRHDPVMITDPRQKATGPQAQTMVSGGRAIGAGANQAKGAEQPEVHPDAAEAHQRGRRGRHRTPEDEAVDRRVATGRQDPKRVAAGRRAAEQKKEGKQRQSQNGQDRGPFNGAGQAPDPNVDYDAWREYTRQHAPAKSFLWDMLHRGSKDLAKHGTRQLLASAWRTVFDTRPPGEKPPKK